MGSCDSPQLRRIRHKPGRRINRARDGRSNQCPGKEELKRNKQERTVRSRVFCINCWGKSGRAFPFLSRAINKSKAEFKASSLDGTFCLLSVSAPGPCRFHRTSFVASIRGFHSSCCSFPSLVTAPAPYFTLWKYFFVDFLQYLLQHPSFCLTFSDNLQKPNSSFVLFPLPPALFNQPAYTHTTSLP